MSPFRIAAIAGASAFVAAWLTAATATRQIELDPVPDGAAARPWPTVVTRTSPVALDLAAEVARLRERLGQAPAPRESVRDPFSLAPPAAPPVAVSRVAETPTAAAPATPMAATLGLSLVGIAVSQSASGADRTAILTAASGDVLLVGVGDTVEARYTVESISATSVALRDGQGVVRHLALP